MKFTNKRCPHCGGNLFLESDYNDRYEDYLTCLGCARNFDYNLVSRQIAPAELKIRYGIKLTEYHKPAKVRIE